MKRITALVIAAAIFFGGASALSGAGLPRADLGAITDGSFAAETERMLEENLPCSFDLASLAFRIEYLSGQREFDGIFIANDGSLLKDIGMPAEEGAYAATAEIKKYVATHQQRTYFMLLPTAAVIKQQEIPQFAADSLFNQRHMIMEAYRELSGTVTTVDVYQILFNRRGEYIYYNTQDNLTALAGYYIYEEMGARLGLRVRNMTSFDIVHAGHGYRGELCSPLFAPYSEDDVISMYEYSQYERGYNVVHTNADASKTAHSGLYYSEEEAGEDKTDMYFGGLSPRVDIEVEGPYSEWLLVFGDETAKSWLPFVVNHYARATLVDLSQASPELLAAIDVSDYQQVVFAYSVESFMSGASLDKLKNISDKAE